MAKKCATCQSDIYSSICVHIDHEEFTTLQEFIDDAKEKLDSLLEDPDVDLKTLASKTKKRDLNSILQVLIDELVSNTSSNSENSSSTSLDDCTIDWTPIQNCNDCPSGKCDNLQTLINKVGMLLRKTDSW